MMTLPLKDALLMTFSGEWGDESKDTSGVFVLRTTNFTNSGDVSYENVVTRNVSNDKISRKRLKPGDIVLEKSGGTKTTPVGRVVYFDNPEGVYLCNNFTQVLRPNTDLVDGKYLFYALYAKYQFHETDRLYNKTTGIQNLQLGRYLDLLIPVPKLMEQRNIREQLDILHDAIAKRREILKKIDDLVKSQFIEMFGDPAKNDKGWKQTTLKEVAKGKLSYGSGASAVEYDGETRYIRITDITDNGELSEDRKSPSVVDEKYLLHDGDILFARSGATVGKTFLYRSTDGRGIYAGYLIRIIPNQDMVLPQYVFNYTKTDYYASFVRDCQRAVAQPNINAQEYGNLMICVPPIELQEQFTRFVEQTDKSKIPFEMEVAA